MGFNSEFKGLSPSFFFGENN